MSTILKALRRLEEDDARKPDAPFSTNEALRDQLLAEESAAAAARPGVGSRRSGDRAGLAGGVARWAASGRRPAGFALALVGAFAVGVGGWYGLSDSRAPTTPLGGARSAETSASTPVEDPAPASASARLSAPAPAPAPASVSASAAEPTPPALAAAAAPAPRLDAVPAPRRDGAPAPLPTPSTGGPPATSAVAASASSTAPSGVESIPTAPAAEATALPTPTRTPAATPASASTPTATPTSASAPVVAAVDVGSDAAEKPAAASEQSPTVVPPRPVAGAGSGETVRRASQPMRPQPRPQSRSQPEVIRVDRPSLPDLAVLQTSWHPRPERRSTRIQVGPSGESLLLREGDAVGGFVVQEISPSAVLFAAGEVEVRRRVGAGVR